MGLHLKNVNIPYKHHFLKIPICALFIPTHEILKQSTPKVSKKDYEALQYGDTLMPPEEMLMVTLELL
jgi:hypothetical protein